MCVTDCHDMTLAVSGVKPQYNQPTSYGAWQVINSQDYEVNGFINNVILFMISEVRFKLTKVYGYSDLQTLMKDQIYRSD